MKTADLSKPVERIETTIGELIELITQIAMEVGDSEEESYQLASMTLNDLLRRNRREHSQLGL